MGETNMLLDGKTAVIYGAGGLGAGIAHTFAGEGARVFMAARRREPVEALAAGIVATGRSAEAAVLDVLDEAAVEDHLRDIVARAGAVDISLNLTSREDKQGTPLIDMTLEDYTRGPHTALTAQFITARAAARHMVARGAGVILSVTAAPPARRARAWETPDRPTRRSSCSCAHWRPRSGRTGCASSASTPRRWRRRSRASGSPRSPARTSTLPSSCGPSRR